MLTIIYDTEEYPNCYTLGGESLQQQIAEYRETEAAEREWQKTHNA